MKTIRRCVIILIKSYTKTKNVDVYYNTFDFLFFIAFQDNVSKIFNPFFPGAEQLQKKDIN